MFISLKHNDNQRINMKEWTNPLMPVLYTLNILGRLPFTIDKSGELQFRLISPPSAWALVVTALQVWLVARVYAWRLGQARYWNTFDSFIKSSFNLIILNVIFQVPIIWTTAPAIFKAVNRWNVFHESLQAEVKHPVPPSLLRMAYIGLGSILLIEIPIFSLSEHRDNSLFSVLRYIIYIICIFYVSLVVLFWIVFCLLVKYSAQLLRTNLVKSIKQLKLPMREVIATHRRLWLELHGCTIQLAEAAGRMVQMWQTLSFFAIILNSYGLLLCTLVDSCDDLAALVGGFVHISVNVLLIYTFSHFAQKSIRSDFLTTIYSTSWLVLSETCWTELDLLLDAVEMGKSCFSIRSFFTYDRAGLISISHTVLTYLIVTLQLKVATDQEPVT